MVPAKRILLTCAALACACLLLSSCSTLFKKKTLEDEGQAVSGPVSSPAPVAEDLSAKGPAREKELADLQQELALKNEAIADLENKINLLEDKINALETRGVPESGSGQVTYKLSYTKPSEVYQKARKLLLDEKFTDAAQLFDAFAKTHPRHSLADNALYWLGECHYSLGRYQTAVAVFKRLVSTYPTAEKVPDAMLKTGYAYISMDDTERATHYLKQVIKKYPFAPAAEKAQNKLKGLQ